MKYTELWINKVSKLNTKPVVEVHGIVVADFVDPQFRVLQLQAFVFNINKVSKLNTMPVVEVHGIVDQKSQQVEYNACS